MMKYVLVPLLGFLIVVNSCKNESKSEEEHTVESDTETTSTFEEKNKLYTLEEIAKMAEDGTLRDTIDASEISEDTTTVAEGSMQVKTTKLWAGTRNEVLINYSPEEPKQVWRVTVNSEKSQIKSQTGVFPGMTLQALNMLNQEPVDFYGFGWDFGGSVQFKDGTLSDKNLFVYLKTDEKIERKFMGDSPHSSEDSEVKKLHLYVGKIVYEASKIEQP